VSLQNFFSGSEQQCVPGGRCYDKPVSADLGQPKLPDASNGGAGSCGTQGGAGSSCQSGCGSGCAEGANSGLSNPSGCGAGSGPGPCACIAGDSRVPLCEGGCKPACEVQAGDRLIDDQGNEETVGRIFGGIEAVVEIVIAAGSLVCSLGHNLLSQDREIVKAGAVVVGDLVLAADGQPTEVLAVLPKGPQRVYGWSTSPSHIYQAGPLLHHNKTHPQEYITAQ